MLYFLFIEKLMFKCKKSPISHIYVILELSDYCRRNAILLEFEFFLFTNIFNIYCRFTRKR